MGDKEAKFHIKAEGADQAARQTDKAAKSVKDLGKRVEEAGKKSSGASRKIGDVGGKAGQSSGKFNKLRASVSKLTSGIGKLVTGLGALVGLAALWQFFQKWIDYAKKVTAAQKELVRSTKDLDQATKALASQANVMGSPEGMEAARKQIQSIQRSGNLPSFDMANDVAVAVHSAFGTSGKLLTDEQLDIAGEVGGFAQRKGVSGGGINQLLKILSAMGVDTKEKAQYRIQQLSTVQQSSKAKTFEEFITGAIKSMNPVLAQGATPEFAMASYASALDNAGTGAGQKYLLENGLSPEQLNVALPLYSPKQLQRREMFHGLAWSATGEQFTAEAEGYARSTQGQIELIEAEAVSKEASATEDERIGQAMVDRANAEWQRDLGEGRENPLISDYWERDSKYFRMPFARRIKKLPKNKRKAKLESMQRNLTGIFEMNPAEIGRMELMLREAEAEAVLPDITTPQAGAAPAGAAPVGAGAGTTINNHYDNSTDHSLHFYPVAGSKADMGIGGRFQQ